MIDFSPIWGGVGGYLGDVGRVQDVPWRRPREVFSTECLPEGPRERFLTNLGPFCMDFLINFGYFLYMLEAFPIMFTRFSTVFVRMFGATVNEKLKQS